MSLDVFHLQLISAVLTRITYLGFRFLRLPRHIQILNDYCGPFANLLYFHAKFYSPISPFHTQRKLFSISFSRKFFFYFRNVCLRPKCGRHRKGVLSFFYGKKYFCVGFNYFLMKTKIFSHVFLFMSRYTK